jgi:hypothetical protein
VLPFVAVDFFLELPDRGFWAAEVAGTATGTGAGTTIGPEAEG